MIEYFKNTDRVMNDGFCIGVWPGLTGAHLDDMVESVATVVSEQKG